jgi:hypothetical protein
MNIVVPKGTAMLEKSVFLDSRLRGNDEVAMSQHQ